MNKALNDFQIKNKDIIGFYGRDARIKTIITTKDETKESYLTNEELDKYFVKAGGTIFAYEPYNYFFINVDDIIDIKFDKTE